MSSSPYDPLGPAHDFSRDRGAGLESHPPKRVAVFYAAQESSAKEIAERIMLDLRKGGFDVDLHDVRLPFPFDWKHYSAALLAAFLKNPG